MTGATEFENFLLYTAEVPSKLPSVIDISSTTLMAHIDAIEVPPRSPDRLRAKRASGLVMRDSPDLTDASSFEMRLDGSDRSLNESSNESIFDDEVVNDTENNIEDLAMSSMKDRTLDNLHDLDDLDSNDWELLFDELDGDVIFSIDDVVNVVSVHNRDQHGKRQFNPLQCVKVDQHAALSVQPARS